MRGHIIPVVPSTSRRTRVRRAILAVTGAVTALVVIAMPASAAPSPAAPEPLPPPAGQLTVQRSATARSTSLTGTGSPSDTGRRFGVEGADLGSMIAYKGRVAIVFGDTYGAPPANPFLAVKHRDWRSNTMGWLDTSRPPAAGVRISSMITDRPGHAKELLPSLKRKGVEETVIPTGGLTVGDRMYLHYMSVKAFGAAGHWTLNAAGLAHSDDAGRTWTKEPGAVWPGSTRFGQVAYADPSEAGGGGKTVYVYGIPGGRQGGVSLARVPAAQLADKAAYRYWTGNGWSSAESAARTVVQAPVGELSVRYDRFYHRWMMMYLDDPAGKIVMRTAATPTGPWSGPQTVLSTKDYPGAYAPYLTPIWNDGPDVWFTMSQSGPYRVSLMRTRLGPSTGAGAIGPRPKQPVERP